MTFFLLSGVFLWSDGAHAGDVFQSVGDEVTMGMGGTWARVHSTEAGYWFFQVAGGDGWMEDMADDLSGYDDRSRIQLSNIAKIQDAQIERCPDGGWLLIGSYTLDSFDDSSQAWRFDDDFTPRWNLVVAERDSTQKHNDMVPVCATGNEGVIYAGGVGGASTAVYVPLDGGVVGTPIPMEGVHAEGASSAEYGDEGGNLVVDVNGPGSKGVTIRKYDAEWNNVGEVKLTLSADNVVWPERIQQLNDGWLLTYLTNTSNSPLGDVWLAALDADFKLVDTIEVNAAGGQDNRPWFARKGNTVLMSYDRDVQPRVRFVTLKDGADGGDDGIPDTAAPEDSGGSSDDTAADTAANVGNEKECACATTSAMPVLGVVGLAALALARRNERQA